jgi:nicotinate-nucleotide pyrophosphorylase (carboxylating)
VAPDALVPPPDAVIAADVARALAEDLGPGDATADLLDDGAGEAFVVAKEAAVIAGRPWFDASFLALDPAMRIAWRVREGERVAAGTVLCTLAGRARALVSAERCALNILQTL